MKSRKTLSGKKSLTPEQLKIVLPIIIVLVLLVLAKIFVPSFLNDRKAQNAAELKQALVTYTQTVGAKIKSELDTRRAQLDVLSHEPLTLAVFQQFTQERAGKFASRYLPEFSDAISLRLISNAQIDNSFVGHDDLSYASREMIRAAVRSDKPVDVEWHFPEHDEEHVVLVQRVASEDAETIYGALHLTLATAPFKQAFSSQAVRSDTYTELRQVIASGGSVALDAVGDKNHKGAPSDAVTYRIPGTMWTLSAVPTNVSVITESNVGRLASLLGLAALLGGLLWWVRYRRNRPVVKKVDPSVTTAIDEKPELTVAAIQEKLQKQGNINSTGLHVEEEEAFPNRVQNSEVAKPDNELEIDDEEIEVPEIDENNQPAMDPAVEAPASIFRAYDIRGVVDETLTEKVVYNIGRALGSEALNRGDDTVVVGRDGRLSSPALSQALIKGLTESGRNVIDIGMVPTPVLYFATHFFDTNSGIMITGSHNPPNYNGIKMVLGGVTLANEAIQSLRERILTNDYTSGSGTTKETEIGSEYIRRITDDIPVALSNSFKVVVDAGNGVAGALGPQLIRALGHDVIELYCEIDGTFPNHHPDPSQPENLVELIDRVKSEGADLGLAFDGDGDRLGVVDRDGNVIWPDRQMMLFARDVVGRNPGGEIIFDVKCSNHLRRVIEEAGGKATMWKTGHSLIKAKMKESGALLAGEMSGHVFFKERWYGFDDGLYTAARLLEILSNADEEPHEILAALPGGVSTPELRLNMHEDKHAAFMATLNEIADFGDGEVGTIDGIRVDFADGWGLIRPSNTTPCLVMRFEADNEAALKRIQEQFRTQLLNLDRELMLPY